MAEIEFAAPNITGTLKGTIVEIPTNAPGNVIPSTSSWRVDTSWFLTPPGKIVGGTWRVQVIVEGLGSAPEGETVQQVVAIDGRTTPPGPDYTSSFTFSPAQNNALLQGKDSVLLQVTVALTYRAPNGSAGPFAAFLDLGLVELFKNQP